MPDLLAKRAALIADRADLVASLKPFPTWAVEATTIHSKIERIDTMLILIHRLTTGFYKHLNT